MKITTRHGVKAKIRRFKNTYMGFVDNDYIMTQDPKAIARLIVEHETAALRRLVCA